MALLHCRINRNHSENILAQSILYGGGSKVRTISRTAVSNLRGMSPILERHPAWAHQHLADSDL